VGLTVIGTVGILVSVVRVGLLDPDDAQELLDKMIAAGYRSPVQRLDEI
jgi:predicted nucleic acid-binding protein